MTWVTNKTWVDGDTPSADDFNTFIRDQLAHVDQHNHDGLPGSGSATLDDVDYVDFDDQASGRGAAESGQTRMWSESDGIHIHPNGGSEAVLSNTSHTHLVTDKQQGEQQRIESNRSALEAALDADEGGGNPTSYGTIPNKAHTMTPTAGNSVVISGFNVFWGQDSDSNSVGQVTGFVKLTRAGTQVKETSNIVSSSSASYLFAGSVQSTFVDSDEPASSTAYGAEFKVARNSGDGSHCAGSGVTAVEVGV